MPPSLASLIKRYLPLALFAVLWLDMFRLLSTQWETREQYAYGWFVPILALGLFWKRWQTRPLAAPKPGESGPATPKPGEGGSVRNSEFEVQSSELSSQHSVAQPAPSTPRLFLVSIFCFLLLPLRVIYEINTDWPLIAWLYALIVVALTLYAFRLADPFSGLHVPRSAPRVSRFTSYVSSFFSPWVKHFAFPVCFILVAVVWPYRIEKGLTQDLMQVVANITVEILGWLNIPALQRGNLIDLGTGTVGIDEACSGIRSFQSSLMAGLLMGELYRLRLGWRAGLVASGLFLGFCFNVVRTTILSYQANANGMSAIDKWHDPAGFTIAIACFGCLWLIALLIKKAETRKQKTDITPDAPPSTLHASPSSLLQPLAFSLYTSRAPLHTPHSALRTYLAAVGLWALLCIGVTELWYRAHTPKDSGVFHWSVALPANKPSFQRIELAPRTIKLLKYDQAATGKWRAEDGSEWSAHFFRWQPRSIESVINSRVHRPEVCLPASGLRQVSKSELIQIEAGQLTLPFRKYTYESDGRNLYVFFCQWEDGTADQVGMQSSGQADRLQSVLKGRRLVGQQTLEIIITDCASLDQAEQQLRRALPGMIRPDPVTFGGNLSGTGTRHNFSFLLSTFCFLP